MSISEEVQLLINRMDEHPEEFVHSKWDPVTNDAWDYSPWEGCRWGLLLGLVFKSGNDIIFTPEEVAALKEKHKELIRAKAKNSIMVELVSGERQKSIEERAARMAEDAKQMNLPYMPAMGGGILNSNTILSSTKIDPGMIYKLQGE